MNRNLNKIDRAVYGTFDWLGDIGGFKESLSWFAFLILFFFQFEPLDLYMIDKLYTFKEFTGGSEA